MPIPIIAGAVGKAAAAAKAAMAAKAAATAAKVGTVAAKAAGAAKLATAAKAGAGAAKAATAAKTVGTATKTAATATKGATAVKAAAPVKGKLSISMLADKGVNAYPGTTPPTSSASKLSAFKDKVSSIKEQAEKYMPKGGGGGGEKREFSTPTEADLQVGNIPTNNPYGLYQEEIDKLRALQ